MTIAWVSLLVGFTLAFAIYAWQNRKEISKRGMLFDVPYPPPNPICLGLRDQVLQGTRAKFDLAPASTPGEPWAVMMDWGLANGTATVVAFSDGHASVYTSTGGGSIGGGQSHEVIREAAKKAVAIATEFRPQMHATASFLLPRRREVTFYVLSDTAVLANTVPANELRTRQHPFTRLGDAMQAIITQYRMIQTEK